MAGLVTFGLSVLAAAIVVGTFISIYNITIRYDRYQDKRALKGRHKEKK